MDQEQGVDQVSHNLVYRIFEHLDLRSLEACRLVCKLWATIIGSTDFARSFHARPSTQPRLVLALWYKNNNHFQSLSSSPHLNEQPHASFASRRSHLPPIGYDCVYGLICQGSTIINPSLGKEIDLPLISPADWEEQRLLGFDPVHFSYKILTLRMNKRSGLGDYQVHTLGDDPRSWRIVNSATPELPKTKTACINGMMYYFILTGGKCSLVRFDVAAERLDFFPVADEASYSLPQHLDTSNTLLAFKGKLGFISPSGTSKFGLWVLDDLENQSWSKSYFSIGRGLNYYQASNLGALSFNHDTDEIVLAACDMSGRIYFVFIDVDTMATRQIMLHDYEALSQRGFAIREYRETTMLL